MLLALAFSAFAVDPVAPAPPAVATPAPTDPAAPAPSDPCIVVSPSPVAPADASVSPIPTSPAPLTPIAATEKCPATDVAAPPADAKKKKSLKKTDNNRMEAESTDE